MKMRQQEIAELLPSVIRRAVRDGTPMSALLAAMEHLLAPAEEALSRLDETCDPWRAPESFLPYLARWVDLDVPVTTGTGRQRALIAAAVGLHQWRGTRAALISFLEIASGMAGFQVEETVLDGRGRIRPFHIRVTAPAGAAAHTRMIQSIIHLEKPAHVTYELAFETSRTPPTRASTSSTVTPGA